MHAPLMCPVLRPPLQALLCLAALVGGSRVQQDQLAALAVKDAAGQAQPLLQASGHNGGMQKQGTVDVFWRNSTGAQCRS